MFFCMVFCISLFDFVCFVMSVLKLTFHSPRLLVTQTTVQSSLIKYILLGGILFIKHQNWIFLA